MTTTPPSRIRAGSFADEATKLERTLGRLIAGLAALLLVTWVVSWLVPRWRSPDNNAFPLIAGLWLLPFGWLLIGAANAFRGGTRFRWLRQGLPIVYVIAWAGMAALMLH
jgi:hypothetical protein